MINAFAVSSILIFVSLSFIAILVLWKGKDRKTKNVWFCLCLVVASWGFGGYKFATATSQEDAYFWRQIANIGVIFTPVLYYHFIYLLLGLEKKYQSFIRIISYILGIIFLFLNFFAPPNLFNGGLRFVFNEFYYSDWFQYRSLLYIAFYVLFYWFLLIFAFGILVSHFIQSKGLSRNQLKYIIFASLVAWIAPHSMFLIEFHIDIYPLPNFLIAIYPLIIAYAIIKYRLMDIKLAITRAGIFVAVYTLVLGLPFALAGSARNWLIENLGSQWWMAPLGLMAGLATVGPFVYIYLQRKAEEKLLREQRRYQDTLKQASLGMTRIRNLNKLLNLITHIITRTVGITYAGVYLYNQDTDEYVLQVSRDKGRVPVPKLSPDNPLISWIMVKREPMIYEEVKRMREDTKDPTFVHFEEVMHLLTASVIIPIFLEDKFLGFVVLGDKISGQIYTDEDLSVFQVLASQAALAIENAQFYEDAKEMQEQIAQAEKMATIGTMADGLSHQINNRFYALSLIAGDSIDTIKMMDTSKCTPEVKDMIEQLNHALERIQVNVMQGGEVVKGIMKYTRKGEEKFEPLTMDQIIDGTLEMVQYKVKLSEIDIARDYQKDGFKIKGNLIQLQEVFFNFIDNANDAIAERKATLKEEGYRGKITIRARALADRVEIIFEDNGMGIKEENEKKIFTPFFTTKMSSRRGTGLGLYVIRRIIEDMHKGTITHESQYKSGTRFIVELPLDIQPSK